MLCHCGIPVPLSQPYKRAFDFKEIIQYRHEGAITAVIGTASTCIPGLVCVFLLLMTH